jgi:uncharacterized membrane protein
VAVNQFSVGKVLGTGFRIWFKNLIPFMLITALIYTPLVVWGISIVQGEPELESLVSDLGRFSKYSAGLVMLLNIFVSAALTYGVVMELQGQHASVGSCIATGMTRFFPVLGVAFMTSICVIGGAILLVIPGIIVACMLYVSTQVAVLEQPGVMASLSRSRELTKDRRLQIFGLLLLLGVMNWGLMKIIETVMLDPGSVTEDNVHSKLRMYMYVDLGRALIVGSLGSVFAAVSYYFLRGEKEGTSAAELAHVFE